MKRIWGLSILGVALLSGTASAANPGDLLETNTVGMNAVTWNLSKGTNKTIADEQVLSEFVGLHVYTSKTVRFGVNFQFSEQIAPRPKTGDRFRTFGVAPQVCWNFYDPFFVAGAVNILPRTGGQANLTLGFKAIVGLSVPIVDGVKATAQVTVPYAFYPEHTIGITPLVGVSFRL